MATPLFALIVLGGAALYFMKPEERMRLLRAAAAWLLQAARKMRDGREPYDELDALILARTPRLIVTPAIVAVWIIVWMGEHMSAGTPADALIAWGANHAPHTTAGEWSRLFTYSLVNATFFQLLAAILATVAIGMVVERLVGRLAFAAVYIAAALAGGVVSLWTLPATSTSAGASAAVFGIVGLLLAVLVCGYARAPRLPVSGLAARRIGAATLIFALTALLTDDVPTSAEVAGLAMGFMGGFVLATGVVEARAAFPKSLALAAAATLVAMAMALPMRGTIDAR